MIFCSRVEKGGICLATSQAKVGGNAAASAEKKSCQPRIL